jgi:hypothetical protein
MTIEQIIYVIVASILSVLIICLWLYSPFKKLIYHFRYKSIYAKELYNIALDNDYYLINNLTLKLDDELSIHVDHILFGDKYIYVVRDRYYNGLIAGIDRDKKFVLKKRKNQLLIDNPLIKNSLRVEKLALITHFKASLFISLVVVNDNCLAKEITSTLDNSFIVGKSQIKKLIRRIESREIETINEDQLRFAVKDIARINENNKIKN